MNEARSMRASFLRCGLRGKPCKILEKYRKIHLSNKKSYAIISALQKNTYVVICAGA